ncbi:MAG: ribonuclease HIII [Erysipelotrichaceae bacterium]|nr:ribonuclease HIII [Erysipelotrichaceae bacterium]
MSNISLKLSKEKIEQLKNTFKADIKPNKNEYIDTFIQRDKLTISIYTSGKVVFQGEDALFYGSAYLDKKIVRQAGSDEVGTGDFFGPVCVCACIVEEEQFPLLDKLGVTDSKQLTDDKIVKIAPTLMKELKHSLCILDNEKYNRAHEKYNLNAIKAKLHNQAYINLLHKGYSIPKAAYVDEFAAKPLYFKYLMDDKEVYHDLTFETKAESKYPAVAAASCIARYAFIKKMEEMEAKYKMSFHKGAGDDVNKDANAFAAKYGKNRLNEVSKTHFKNYELVK